MFYRVIIVLYSITIVFSIASELRIGGLFGISEFSGMLFLLLSSCYLLRDGIHLNYIFSIFTIISLMILITSSILNSVEGNPIEIRDFFAYIYAWVVTQIFISLVLSKPKIFNFFLNSILIIGLIYCFIINVGSYYYQNFIYQGFRLSGWSTNPNQFALLLVFLIGSLIYFKKILNYNSKIYYMFNIVFIITALRTLSDALLLSLGVSIVMYLIVSSFLRIGFLRFLAITCIIISISLFSIISIYEQIPSYMASVFDGMNENSQGDDRINLWKNGIYSIENSLMIGNGTGAHSGAFGPFENTEAHNTYIDWLSQTGLIGLSLLLIFLCYCFLNSRIYSVSSSLFYYTFICIFVSFHFVLRQPIFWLYIMLPVIYHNLSLFNKSKIE